MLPLFHKFKMEENMNEPMAKRCIELGHYYFFFKEKRTAKDSQKAANWYAKAAEAGNKNGQFWYGSCFYLGDGREKDYGQAVFWLEKAAEQGHFGAQKLLGDCYFHGYGVAQDYRTAVEWYRTAEKNGLGSAKKLIKEVEKHSTTM